MYGAVDDEGVLLIADEADLASLIEALDRGGGHIALGGESPLGYLGAALSALSVVVNDEPLVRVGFDDDALQIAASTHALSRLAHELRDFVAGNDLQEPGMHTHFDPGDSAAMNVKDILIAADSVPLMVAGPVYG